MSLPKIKFHGLPALQFHYMDDGRVLVGHRNPDQEEGGTCFVGDVTKALTVRVELAHDAGREQGRKEGQRRALLDVLKAISAAPKKESGS